MAKKLQKKDIVQICNDFYSDSKSYISDIRKDQELGLQLYDRDLKAVPPLSENEQGFSKFVSSTVFDAVHWALPQLLEVFNDSETTVAFVANNQNDIQAAEQETDVVRHAFYQWNNGFEILQTWLTDGLLAKNGLVRCTWDESVNEEENTYTNLSDDQLTGLLQDEYTELTRQVIDEDTGNIEYTFVCKKPVNRPLVENIPPEKFFVNRDHGSLDLSKAQYCAYREEYTADELARMGYDKKLIDKASESYKANDDYGVGAERHEKEGGLTSQGINSTLDKSSRLLEVVEHYVRIDDDGDGKAELNRVVTTGAEHDIILEQEKVTRNPFHAWSPLPNAHKFYGNSYADVLKDLQRLESTLMRETINSAVMANRPQKEVNVDAIVHMDDVINHTMGGVIRSRGGNAVREIVTPFVAQHSIGVMEYLQGVIENRTGINKQNQGLDPAALKDSTNMVGMTIMNQAVQRVKLIARNFAETGLRSLFLHIHELMQRHGSEQDVVEIRGQYVPVDPRMWQRRNAMRVLVGTGHASKMEKLAGLQAVLDKQFQIYSAVQGEGALVQAKHIYNTLDRMVEFSGVGQGGEFFGNPAEWNPPPKQDVQSEALQIAEAEQIRLANKEAAEVAQRRREHEDKMRLEQVKLLLEDQRERERFGLEVAKNIEDKRLEYFRESNKPIPTPKDGQGQNGVLGSGSTGANQ